MTFESLAHYFLIFCISVLGVLGILCLIRAIIGPRISDRIVGINMIGTQVIILVALVALLLGEESLADIAIVYAFLNFLSVVIITKIYIGIYQKQLREQERAVFLKQGVAKK